MVAVSMEMCSCTEAWAWVTHIPQRPINKLCYSDLVTWRYFLKWVKWACHLKDNYFVVEDKIYILNWNFKLLKMALPLWTWQLPNTSRAVLRGVLLTVTNVDFGALYFKMCQSLGYMLNRNKQIIRAGGYATCMDELNTAQDTLSDWK